MTLDQRKIDLIQRIARTTDEEKIDAVEKIMSDLVTSRIDLSKYKDLKQTIDLEEIKRRQPLKPFDIQAFFKETEDIEWEQSIEELLADLD